MSDIKLTPEHDLFIEDGDIVIFSQIENLTVQKVKINLLNYRGEWFRDVNVGVPYLQQILGRRGTKETADAILKDTITSTDNIESITEYESHFGSDRQFIVTFSAAMTSGGSIQNITVEL